MNDLRGGGGAPKRYEEMVYGGGGDGAAEANRGDLFLPSIISSVPREKARKQHFRRKKKYQAQTLGENICGPGGDAHNEGAGDAEE